MLVAPPGLCVVAVPGGITQRRRAAGQRRRGRVPRVRARPLALCLHGFPDSRPHVATRVAGPRRRRLPRRRSRSNAATHRREVPKDGRYQTGALALDAIDAARGAGRRRRRRHHRTRLGCPGHVRSGQLRRRALVEGRRHGGASPALRSRQAFVDQSRTAQAVLVHVLLPAPAGRSRRAADDLAFIDRLWRDWSPASTPPRSWRW